MISETMTSPMVHFFIFCSSILFCSLRDNEYGSRSYDVPAFSAAKYKTTNGEFWEFVCDGGYSKAELWSDAGN